MCYAPKLVAWALALVYKGIASPAPVNFAALKTFKKGKKNETIYLLSDTGVTSVWTAQTIFPSQHFGRIFARRTRGMSPNQGFREYRFVTAGKPKALHFCLFWSIYSISIYINLCPSTSIWIYPYLVCLCIFLIYTYYVQYICMYFFTYIFMYFFCIFMYIWCISLCISLCRSSCIHIYIYIYMYVCMYLCIFDAYRYRDVYLYVHLDAYIYASLYTFISILNVYLFTSMYIDLHLSISIPDYLSLSVLYLYLSMSIYVNL